MLLPNELAPTRSDYGNSVRYVFLYEGGYSKDHIKYSPYCTPIHELPCRTSVPLIIYGYKGTIIQTVFIGQLEAFIR